jgi:hypothetical protein
MLFKEIIAAYYENQFGRPSGLVLSQIKNMNARTREINGSAEMEMDLSYTEKGSI